MVEKKILSTKSTPEISLNPNGIIRIKGRAMNENVTESSKQMEAWIDKYICNPADITCVDIYLEYLNDINSKIFISVLRKIESIKLKNKKYIINWYFDEGDDDILEKGEYVSSVLDMPFNFITIREPLMSEADLLK